MGASTRSEGAKTRTLTKPELQKIFDDFYREVKHVGLNDYEKRKSISVLSKGTQMLILSDKGLCSWKDPFGIGPVHDLARWGLPSVQLRIFSDRAAYDTAEFKSVWGTPIDLLALYGSKEVLKRFLVRSRSAELALLRGDGSTLGHRISIQINADNYKMFLRLPRPVLASQNAKGESMIRRMHDCADGEVQNRIYEWDPLWNRMKPEVKMVASVTGPLDHRKP
ncbi:MAG: hypothetical protein KGH94_01600 [Candidatus Micrarchaeota archaeon]|nr:hypothetical protein [Candidatus Micrarchaeota archaeon]